MKDWRVETLYSLTPAQANALEKAATSEVECPFCGQPAGRWCRVNQKEFLYTPSPHMARKFAWLEAVGQGGAALVLLDVCWTPNKVCSCCGLGPEACPRLTEASATCAGGDCGCFS